MKRSYNLIVPFYDKLVKLIYGNALRNAQTLYLPLIPAYSTILIAGGGTGWILEEITKIHPQGLSIDYLDISSKMIAQAKKKLIGKNEVNFINQSILTWQPDKTYDVILTPFFFDNFSQQNAQIIFSKLHTQLKPTDLWLHTDFQIAHSKAHWQKALLFTMYTFFRFTVNIEAKKLPDITSLFQSNHYQQLNTTTFFHQFITTSVYKKANS